MKLNDEIQTKGFTTFELLVAILIVGILTSLALPTVGGYLEKRRIIAAAEEIYSQLQFARSETLKQSDSLNINFALNNISPSTSWSLGISTDSCNPNITNIATTNACIINLNGTDVLKRINSADFADVSMTTPTFPTKLVGGVSTQETGFEPVRGTAFNSAGNFANGTIVLTSSNYQMNIVLAFIGRIRVCSPSGITHVTGYPGGATCIISP